MCQGDVLLATAISTGFATGIMGLVANYPWVCSVQLGTNVYFVYQVIKPGTKPEYCPAGAPIPAGGCDGYEIPYTKVSRCFLWSSSLAFYSSTKGWQEVADVVASYMI